MLNDGYGAARLTWCSANYFMFCEEAPKQVTIPSQQGIKVPMLMCLLCCCGHTIACTHTITCTRCLKWKPALIFMQDNIMQACGSTHV
jgi:hypothetical protein